MPLSPSPNPDRPPLRGVIVGGGAVATRGHIPAYFSAHLARRFQILGVVDPAPGVAPGHGIPVLDRLDRIRDLGPVDFLDVCTPTALHLRLTLWGLEHGFHVLCEKPVALNRNEAEQIAVAAKRAGRVVLPCHQYRYNPAWLKIREWLKAGRIGRWHLGEFIVRRTAADAGAGGAADTPWRGRREKSRGGILLDHGTHLIYLVLDLAGLPQETRCWTGRLRREPYEVEDTAHVLLRYPDRAVTFFLTWADQTRATSIRFTGERGLIEWTEGVLCLDCDTAHERLDLARELAKSAYPSWFARLFRRFAAAIERHELTVGLREINEVGAVLEESYASAARESDVLAQAAP